MTEENINENIKIVLGDCLEYMKTLPDKSIDLVLTDPFYLPQNHFDWKMLDDFYWDFNRKWLIEVRRLVKDNFHFFVSFGAPDMFAFEKLLVETGFEIKSRIVWNYRNSTKAVRKDTQFAKTYEFIFHCSSGKKLNFPKKWDDRRFDVRIIAMPQSNFIKEHKEHPYQKPMELWNDFVEFGSSENELVLDPFAGSFTTGVACAKLNRKFIGVEISERYYAIGRERIKREISQLKLL